ncbi:MAG: hypothetical protein ABH829_04130 [archaeon]
MKKTTAIKELLGNELLIFVVGLLLLAAMAAGSLNLYYNYRLGTDFGSSGGGGAGIVEVQAQPSNPGGPPGSGSCGSPTCTGGSSCTGSCGGGCGG